MLIDWSKVFEQALGIILGGGITITALALKELFDRRRYVQSWFEQYYITESLDKLILHLSSLGYALDDFRAKGQFPSELLDPYPREAAERFRLLFPGGVVLLLWIIQREAERVRDASVSWNSEAEWVINITATMRKDLIGLHKELLDIKIKNKAAIHGIKNQKKISPSSFEDALHNE